MIKILYISALSSPAFIDSIYAQTGRNPGFAMQRFNRLIATGLAKNGASVQTLSGIPNVKLKRSLFYKESEVVDGVHYNYIPFVKFPFLRHLCLFLWSFFYVIFWCKSKRDKRVIFDVLNISVCLGGLLASKIVRLKSCGIMTDMPGLMVGQTTSLKNKLITFVNKTYLRSFDSYVFLTEAMNTAINIKHRPYIIMEGLVPNSFSMDDLAEKSNRRTKSLMYAGGLFERYGIKLLIEAFLKLDDKDLTLDFYGHGPMVDEINEYHKKDGRVRFHGIVPNNVIVEEEKNATLLINPRPTFEEYTQYSFPSKNMEYMVSGTPVLTTKLPGMPKEYYPYIFIIEDETVEGFRQTMASVLSLSNEQLERKGREGKQFVLKYKNNVTQSARILELLKII